MADLPVIDAEFVAFRTVAGRKCLQLQLEIPIERAGEALKKLGTPIPGQCLWVAVARLEENSSIAQRSEPSAHNGLVEGSNPSAATTSNEAKPSGSSKRKWEDMPLSQQCALRCGQPEFQDFIAAMAMNGQTYFSDQDAADYVRDVCGITSRSNLDDVKMASARFQWTRLEADFQNWLTDRKYAGAKHG